jgi:hypothetical protein
MGLFDMSEVDVPDAPVEEPRDGATRMDAATHHGRLTRHVQATRLAELIPSVEQGACYHVVSAGSWNNYDLVEYLARMIGPGELWLSTWGISDPGVRAVDRMISGGWITDVHCLLDGHTAVQHSAATAFLQSISARLGILSCHAKVYVIIGIKLAISIVTSANLTNNPYIEAGIVIVSHEVAAFHRDWIDRAIKRSTPFEAPE